MTNKSLESLVQGVEPNEYFRPKIFNNNILLIISSCVIFVTLSILFIIIFQMTHEINTIKLEVNTLKDTIKELNNRYSEIKNDNYNLQDFDYGSDDYNYYDQLELLNERSHNEKSMDFSKTYNSREKREINTNVPDVNTESVEIKRRNKSVHFTTPSTQNSFPADSPVNLFSTSTHTRKNRPRVSERTRYSGNNLKKSMQLRSGGEFSELEEDDIEMIESPTEASVIKPRRVDTFSGRSPRMGRMRPLPAAHFSGTTTKYILGKHMNFKGNGHLRHHEGTYVDWEAENWVSTLEMNKYFHMHDGVLVINDTGLYFIYAQIYHLDEHDVNGFRVFKNDINVLQCTKTGHSPENIIRGNTCYTGGAVYLEEGDRITIKDLFESRYSLFETGKSFFGVIKLGDVRKN